MQAWGVQSHFSIRDTMREPTRSGVIGLLCSALGWNRDVSLDVFSSLRMGVRVDREGILMMDFQIAQDVMNASGKKLKFPVISNRYYLANAVYLVGLESEDLDFLEEIQAALKYPEWLLFLGRRAFPPSMPVWLVDGVQEGHLEEILHEYPWLIFLPEMDYQRKNLPTDLRFVMESEDTTLSQMDIPLSYEKRVFRQRKTKVVFNSIPTKFIEEVKDVFE